MELENPFAGFKNLQIKRLLDARQIGKEELLKIKTKDIKNEVRMLKQRIEDVNQEINDVQIGIQDQICAPAKLLQHQLDIQKAELKISKFSAAHRVGQQFQNQILMKLQILLEKLFIFRSERENPLENHISAISHATELVEATLTKLETLENFTNRAEDFASRPPPSESEESEGVSEVGFEMRDIDRMEDLEELPKLKFHRFNARISMQSQLK